MPDPDGWREGLSETLAEFFAQVDAEVDAITPQEHEEALQRMLRAAFRGYLADQLWTQPPAE